MNKKNTTLGIMGGLLFAVLLIHDYSLYWYIQWPHLILTSLLRVLVLILTAMVSPVLVSQMNNKSYGRYALFVLWLLLIPYTLYNSTQIRHIAEICRLLPGQYFADQCSQSLWKIFPPFVYALSSLVIFFYSVTTVLHAFSRKWTQSALVIILLYSSCATVFGIYTRLDTLSIFIDPLSTLILVKATMTNPIFWLNSLIFFGFGMIVYYGGQTLVRWKSGHGTL